MGGTTTPRDEVWDPPGSKVPSAMGEGQSDSYHDPGTSIKSSV